MNKIRDFKQLLAHLAGRDEKKKMAVVWAADECTREAVTMALEKGFVKVVFVGCRAEVEADPELAPYAADIQFVDVSDSDAAAAAAVLLAREGGADIVMKGMLNTDNLLRAVLNKENGILPKGQVLTHITTAQIPAYDKLLLFSDAAVIPYPTPEQMECQVKYLADAARRLGEEHPRIALVHCTEKVDERHFPFTAKYKELSERSAANLTDGAIIDGPMDVKTACSLEAMKKKHLTSPINGEADAILFPDIQAGNAFYKTITLFAGAQIAGMLCGTMVPVVLPSRGDTPESKLYSIAMAAL